LLHPELQCTYVESVDSAAPVWRIAFQLLSVKLLERDLSITCFYCRPSTRPCLMKRRWSWLVALVNGQTFSRHFTFLLRVPLTSLSFRSCLKVLRFLSSHSIQLRAKILQFGEIGETVFWMVKWKCITTRRGQELTSRNSYVNIRSANELLQRTGPPDLDNASNRMHEEEALAHSVSPGH